MVRTISNSFEFKHAYEIQQKFVEKTSTQFCIESTNPECQYESECIRAKLPEGVFRGLNDTNICRLEDSPWSV